MECFCKTKTTNSLKIEADYVIDPIWCTECDCNLEMELLPLTVQLKRELYNWVALYGNWRDMKTGMFVKNAYEVILHYNNRGRYLTEKVKQELMNEYTVEYSNCA